MPLLCSVLLSGPHLDMRRRELLQQTQRALADAPDGVSDPEGIRVLPGVIQGHLCVAEGLRWAMAAKTGSSG